MSFVQVVIKFLNIFRYLFFDNRRKKNKQIDTGAKYYFMAYNEYKPDDTTKKYVDFQLTFKIYFT